MPRGAEFDNGIPQSDNAIETGPNKAHGTNPVRLASAFFTPITPQSSYSNNEFMMQGSDIDRSNKAASLPETMGGNNLASGGGSAGSRATGSGKGGHEPKTLGEKDRLM